MNDFSDNIIVLTENVLRINVSIDYSTIKFKIKQKKQNIAIDKLIVL